MDRFEGKVAIITGAKIVDGGGNIGSATAAAMAREGASVVVTDLDGAGAERVAAQIRSAGGRAAAVAADISIEADWDRAVATAVEDFGGLDILVNNAAWVDYAGDEEPLTMDPAVWNRTLAVNSGGAMLGCKHALPVMIEAGGGAIVNLTSIQALAGHVARPAYAASKAAIITLTKYVAATYGRQGIRCNAVAPGLTMSALAEGLIPQAVKEVYQRHQLVGRLARPEDIADAILFLASEEAALITGQVLPVDGGVTAVRPEVADFLELEAIYTE